MSGCLLPDKVERLSVGNGLVLLFFLRLSHNKRSIHCHLEASSSCHQIVNCPPVDMQSQNKALVSYNVSSSI